MFNKFTGAQIFIFLVFILPADHSKQNANNEFIMEYFLYRAPSTVVAFTCNEYESDVQLLRKLSKKLQTVIWKLEKKIEIPILAKAKYRRLGVFIDLRCQFTENVKVALDEAANHRMFDELYYWLILGLNLNESISLINDSSFGLSTDFVLAILEENQCTLYDIYNPCKLRGGNLKTTKVGIWNESTGLNIITELNKIRRWNLEGMTLKMSGFIKNRPQNKLVFDYLEDFNFMQFDRSTRLGYMMWKHVMDKFNFTLDFHEETVWNDDDLNGPVLNALIKGYIDASLSADTMTSENVDKIKAVYPAIPYRTCFIFRSTSSDRLSVRDIFLPLSTTVWYLTIAISILSINALAFLLLFTRGDFYENYLHSIIINVGAFCQQGTEFSSNNLSGRIAILHILLFNLLLYNYYLASAVSNRLSEPVVFINDSLNELKKKNFLYASQPMLGLYERLISEEWETRSFYVDGWLKTPEKQRFMQPDEGMASVLEGGFAYHTFPEMSYPYIERHFDDRKICELQEVHLFGPLQQAIFVNANSSFTEMLKSGFLRLSEVGIRYRQVDDWTSRKPICRSDVLTADSVTLNEVAPAIIFLMFSILVSLIFLIMEFMFSLYSKGSIRFGLKLEIMNTIRSPSRSSSKENFNLSSFKKHNFLSTFLRRYKS